MRNLNVGINGNGFSTRDGNFSNPVHSENVLCSVRRGPVWSDEAVGTGGIWEVELVQPLKREGRPTGKLDRSMKRELKKEVNGFLMDFGDIRARQIRFANIKRKIPELFEFVKDEDSLDGEILAILDHAVSDLRSENLTREQADSIREVVSLLEWEDREEEDVDRAVKSLIESGIRLIPKAEGLWKHY